MNNTNFKLANMEIKVLGTGCAKCKLLEKHTLQAISELGLDAQVVKVEDIVEIMKYGVMSTPALVVNGKVVIKGKVAGVEEIKQIIK